MRVAADATGSCQVVPVRLKQLKALTSVSICLPKGLLPDMLVTWILTMHAVLILQASSICGV